MKNFEKYIYIGDIHGCKAFVDLIEQKDDGKTFFILLGDIFDRGNASYEVFETIKRLHSEGKLQMVLGNHDLFFIFKYLTEKPFKKRSIFEMQYDFNGGKNTTKSFEKHIVYKQGKTKSECLKYLKDTAKFLFENFDTYYVSPLNHLCIHGGLPIFANGKLVGEYFGEDFFSGFDYIKELNRKLKSFDETTLEKFTAHYSEMKILSENGFSIQNPKDDYCFYLPTWYLNRLYDENETILESLKQELEKYGFEKFICGHDRSGLVIDEKKSIFKPIMDGKVIRLDNSSNISIGYCEFNNNGKFLNGGTWYRDEDEVREEEVKRVIEMYAQMLEL